MKFSITFVALAFNEPHYDRQLVDSLMMQTDINWELIVYHNGRNVEMREWVYSYNDPRIRYMETVGNNNNSCLNRLDALNHIKEGYVIQTSIQDYYIKWAVELIRKRVIETDADMCFWDSINHLSGYEVLDTRLEMGHIDWGNFCMPINIAREIGIPGIEPGIRREDDWYTIQEGLQRGLLENKTKIANVLTIHN